MHQAAPDWDAGPVRPLQWKNSRFFDKAAAVLRKICLVRYLHNVLFRVSPPTYQGHARGARVDTEEFWLPDRHEKALGNPPLALHPYPFDGKPAGVVNVYGLDSPL